MYGAKHAGTHVKHPGRAPYDVHPPSKAMGTDRVKINAGVPGTTALLLYL